MPGSLDDPKLLSHFSVAVYPFFHDLTGPNLENRLRAVESRWVPGWSRFTDDELARTLESTSDLPTAISRFLYPEIGLLEEEVPDEPIEHRSARLRHLIGSGLVGCWRELPSESVIRLTVRPELHDLLKHFELDRPWMRGSIENRKRFGRLEWIDALLFPCGTGFLMLKVRLQDDYEPLSKLIDFNSVFRHVWIRFLAAQPVEFAFPKAKVTAQAHEFLRFLIQGLTATDPGSPAPTVPLAIPKIGFQAPTAFDRTCRLVSYACFGLSEPARAEVKAGVFPSGEDRLLFEFVASIPLGQSVANPVWVPAPDYVERLRQVNRLTLWKCWSAMALKEGFGILAHEDLQFTRTSLPRNMEGMYLPLYLYTYYQALRLGAYSRALVGDGSPRSNESASARTTLQPLNRFLERCPFDEEMNRLGDLYQLFKRVMGLPELYEKVTSKWRDKQTEHQESRKRVVQWAKDLMSIGGSVSAAAGVITGALVWLAHFTHDGWGLITIAAPIVFVMVALVLFWKSRTGGKRRGRGSVTFLSPRSQPNEHTNTAA